MKEDVMENIEFQLFDLVIDQRRKIQCLSFEA